MNATKAKRAHAQGIEHPGRKHHGTKGQNHTGAPAREWRTSHPNVRVVWGRNWWGAHTTTLKRVPVTGGE